MIEVDHKVRRTICKEYNNIDQKRIHNSRKLLIKNKEGFAYNRIWQIRWVH